MTTKEIKQAFLIWSYGKRNSDFHQRLAPFLSGEIQTTPASDSWLQSARKDLQLSGASMAQKLRITPARYSQIEKSEQNKTISLQTLADVAEAMDCELVYAIRPKSKMTFSRIIWDQVAPKALQHPWIANCDQRRRAEALAAICRKLMSDPAFRREKSWSKKIYE